MALWPWNPRGVRTYSNSKLPHTVTGVSVRMPRPLLADVPLPGIGSIPSPPSVVNVATTPSSNSLDNETGLSKASNSKWMLWPVLSGTPRIVVMMAFLRESRFALGFLTSLRGFV